MQYLYIRDDDVYRHDKNFIVTFDFFKKYKIPVIYGIIPKLIEKKAVNFLNKEKKKNPKLFDITQHGWSHKDYSKNLNHKYEFGHSRTYSQQKQDILKGYSKMKKLFAKNFTPAFIPPYHGYNKNTLKIIDELKIPKFSDGHTALTKNQKFLNLPIDINLNDYDKKSEPLSLKSSTMIRRLLISLEKNKSITGVLLHHDFAMNSDNFKNTKVFFLFLKKLERGKKVKLILFSQL